jgi:MFS family permease
MIGYIFQAIIVVAYLAALIGTLIMAVDNEDWRWFVPFTVLLILLIAFAIKSATEEEAQGPCLKKETSYTYNSATKTMMPYTKCVERGEWVK